MDSIYEVSLSLTIKTSAKRRRVPLGKVLSAETISSIRDAAIAYGCVPNSYPISAYEESSINVSFCETKDRTFKGRVAAADKESAEAKAINNLMVVAVEKMAYNMSAIEAVSVKQVKKTRMTTPIIHKEDREATLDMIKLANGQCYNSSGVETKVDVLTPNTPYKYVVEDNGYTYLKLNIPRV